MKRRRRTFVALISSLLPGLAAAQFDAGATYQIATNNVAFTQSVLMTNELARVGQHAYDHGAPPPHAGAALHATPADLRVGRDPRVSAQVWKGFIDGIRERSGADVADRVSATFRRKDVRSAFDEAARPYGLRSDDYGDVFAGYLVTLWMTANQAPLPGVREVRSVDGQVHGYLACSGVPADPRQRQLQAEQMMYEVVATIYARQEAERSGNRRALADMAANAQRNFLAHGLNLQAMTLREGSGLVRR
ncbi:MAG TPA: hypothetical protein VGC30_06325 [Dokdonella sp.]